MPIPLESLQVLIVCHDIDKEAGDYPRPKDFVDKIKRAFLEQEANELVRELSLAEDRGTGASVRSFYISGSKTPPFLPSLEKEVNKSLHTLVVVIITTALVRDPAGIKALEQVADKISRSGGRHGLLLLGASEELLAKFRTATANQTLKDLQGRSLETLAEYALRPFFAAILALSKAHRLLVEGNNSIDPAGGVRGSSCFFISHAKLDGLPLAQSLNNVFSQLPWLDRFYDAKDIQPGDDFKEVLEKGVLNSMLIVLRTDIYDLRFWCRQEVMWAEAHDRPVLMVDARTELFNRPSLLGFAGVPGVRIPDGNLVRVLVEGLREWVRIGVLKRRYSEIIFKNKGLAKSVEFLSRQPTLTSLAEALEKLEKRGVKRAEQVRIVYSDPPLESNQDHAVQKLIRSSFPNGAAIAFKNFLALMP